MNIKTFKRLSAILFFLLLFFSIPENAAAQDKKVAIVSFYVNKYVGTDGLAGGAALATTIATLAKDSSFNLKPVLDEFYKNFFEEYSKEFPFKLADEEEIINNEAYQNFRTFDTTNFLNSFTLPREGYNISHVSGLYKKDLKKMIEIFGDAYDGFMWVALDYKIAPKVAIGGMGAAGVTAYVHISIYNKEEKKVISISESAMSKGSVPLVAGIPVMEVKKILPLCKNASEQLFKDLEKKLPKIIKKADKKL